MHKGFALGPLVEDDAAHIDRQFAALQDLGAQIVRFDIKLFGPFTARTDAFLQRYADLISRFSAAGIEVVGLLGSDIVPGGGHWDPHQPTVPAPWNVNDAEHHAGGGSNAFIDRYVTNTTTIVASLQDITRWEIWNEPNAFNWRQGTTNPLVAGHTYIYPSLYATMLQRTFAAIKAVQPHSTVISGGLLGHTQHGVISAQNSGVAYLTSVFQRLDPARLPFDALGQHFYIDQAGLLDISPSGALHTYLALLREVTTPTLPLYITEAAWRTDAIPPAVQQRNLTALYQACQQQSMMEIAALCWFSLRDTEDANLRYGVIEVKDWTPKPSYQAYKRL